MNIMVIINTMIVLFGILIVGYVINKIGILDEPSNRKLSQLVVMVTSPAMIVASVCGDTGSGDKKSILFVFFLGIGLYILLPFLAKILVIPFRLGKSDSATFQLMLIFANTAFIGYPIAQSIYGDKAIFYMAILNMPFNLLIFSYGVFLIARSSGRVMHFNVRDIANPGIIAAIIALIIYLLDIQVPSTIARILGLVGDVTVPLSMMIIGSSLALIPLKSAFTDIKIYPLALVKLLVMPIIGYFILNLFLDDPFIIGIITITLGLPSGSMTVMLSNQYKGNAKAASICVFLTTLMSVVTIPFIVYILLA